MINPEDLPPHLRSVVENRIAVTEKYVKELEVTKQYAATMIEPATLIKATDKVYMDSMDMHLTVTTTTPSWATTSPKEIIADIKKWKHLMEGHWHG